MDEFNHMPGMALTLRNAISKVVRKAAFDIQAETQTNHPWQHRTGFAESSVYVVTKHESTYGQDVKGGGELLPEVEHPTSATEAYVVTGANYFIYLEMGTSKMPAMPSLVPAAERVRPQFEAAMRRLEEKIAAEMAL